MRYHARMPTLPRAMLIDLDDTLLDTTSSSDRLWREVVDDFAGEIGHTPAAINRALDAAREWYWADPRRNRAGRLDLERSRFDVVDSALKRLGIDRRDLAKRFAQAYSDRRVGVMRAYPGVLDALAELRRRGVKLALLTNGMGPTQRDKVDRFELESLFDAVFIEGEIGLGKPEPELFRRALDALGVTAADTWVVGDNLEWEVAAPQRMGMAGIWVDWQGTGLPEDSSVKPDRIIRSITELLN